MQLAEQPMKAVRGMDNSSIGIDDDWQQEASTYARNSAPINATDPGFRCVINTSKPLPK